MIEQTIVALCSLIAVLLVAIIALQLSARKQHVNVVYALRAFLANLRELVAPFSSRCGKLWRFWGPRLTDKNLIFALTANAAAFAGYVASPEMLNTITLVLWIGANLVFPPWEHLPVENLETAQNAPASGPGAEAGVV